MPPRSKDFMETDDAHALYYYEEAAATATAAEALPPPQLAPRVTATLPAAATAPPPPVPTLTTPPQLGHSQTALNAAFGPPQPAWTQTTTAATTTTRPPQWQIHFPTEPEEQEDSDEDSEHEEILPEVPHPQQQQQEEEDEEETDADSMESVNQLMIQPSATFDDDDDHNTVSTPPTGTSIWRPPPSVPTHHEMILQGQHPTFLFDTEQEEDDDEEMAPPVPSLAVPGHSLQSLQSQQQQQQPHATLVTPPSEAPTFLSLRPRTASSRTLALELHPQTTTLAELRNGLNALSEPQQGRVVQDLFAVLLHQDGDGTRLLALLLQWLTEQARPASQLHLFYQGNNNIERTSVLTNVSRVLATTTATTTNEWTRWAQEGAAEVIRTLTAHEIMDPHLMQATTGDADDTDSSPQSLLSLLAHVAQQGASLPARVHASIAIMNLSCGPANKARLAQCGPVLTAMKFLLYETPSAEDHEDTLRLKATTTLKNLSNLDTNDVALISFPGLVHALGQVIMSTTLHTGGPTPSTTNACMALMNLSISKQYKSQVYHTPGIMQALLTVLAQTSALHLPTLTTTAHGEPASITSLRNPTAQEARIRACSVLSNLAIGYDNKMSMFIYPGFVEAILVMIRTDHGEARSKACSILWSLAAEMENQVPMVQDRIDILPVLIQVASDHAVANNEARQKCVACLTLLAESPHNAMALLHASILQPLFEILNQAGSDPTQWKDHTASWCVSCLMNLAQVDAAVPFLRQAGAVELLAPLVVLDQHYQSLKAAMAVTLCCRMDHDFGHHSSSSTQQAQSRQPAASSSSCYYNLLRKTETAIPKIVNLLHNTLAGRGGDGYKFGVFTLSSSVACIAALASGPEFLQEHICTTPVLVSLLQVLWDFSVDGGVPGCIVGGGRDDVASATWAVKAIHSIVKYLLALGGDGSYAYGDTFLQPSLVDPLVRALRSVEERLQQQPSNNQVTKDYHKEICALAGNARELISSAALQEQQRHHERRRRRRRLNTNDQNQPYGDEISVGSDYQSVSSSSSNSSSDGPFVITQSFVMTPETVTTDSHQGKNGPLSMIPTETKSQDSESSNGAASPTTTKTAIRTFLLSDTCSGRRFAVPTDPNADTGGVVGTTPAQLPSSPSSSMDDDEDDSNTTRSPRLWCFRRGRFCNADEVPDPNYIWTPELQRAYELALGHAEEHKQQKQQQQQEM